MRISRHLFGKRSSTMSFRPFVAGVVLLAAAQGTAHAGATLTTNYNTWVANAPPFLSTTDDPNYNGDLFTHPAIIIVGSTRRVGVHADDESWRRFDPEDLRRPGSVDGG